MFRRRFFQTQTDKPWIIYEPDMSGGGGARVAYSGVESELLGSPRGPTYRSQEKISWTHEYTAHKYGPIKLNIPK